jgi:hypothetical protein
VADRQPDGDNIPQASAGPEGAATDQAAAVAPDSALPAEYYRADEALLERTIELTEPYDPEHTIET